MNPTTNHVNSGESGTDKPEASLAWLAGIIDGEGTICPWRYKNMMPRPRVAIYNTNWKIIARAKELLHQITGRKISIMERTRLMPQSRLRQWQIQIQRQCMIVKVLQTLLPYLVGKAAQAETAIALSACLESRDRTAADELAAKLQTLNKNPPQPDREAVETRHVTA